MWPVGEGSFAYFQERKVHGGSFCFSNHCLKSAAEHGGGWGVKINMLKLVAMSNPSTVYEEALH